MGKHRLLMSSEHKFLVPLKKNRAATLVDSAGDQTTGKKLHPGDQLVSQEEHSDDSKTKPKICGTYSAKATAPRSSVFPANYTLHIGKSTAKIVQKNRGAPLSASCLFPSTKQDQKMADIAASSHSFNEEPNKEAHLVRTKALCRREYAIPGRRSSGRTLNDAKTTKSRPASQKPGVKPLLTLIEKTMKEIGELHKRQQALCNKRSLSHSDNGCTKDLSRLHGRLVEPDQKTSVDVTEE